MWRCVVLCVAAACGGGAAQPDARDANVVVDAPLDVAGLDTTPPSFAGVTSAQMTANGLVTLAWTAATDNATAPSQIVYDVYLATSAGGEAFGSAPYATSSAGATSIALGGLAVASYYFVVRARDLAGNRDTNTVELAATVADTTAPTFAGVTSAVATSDTQIMASWSPASDDTTAAGSISYLVCWSTSATACTSSFTAMAATAPGATSYTTGVGALAPSTAYTFVVHAEDTAGNVDTNTATAMASTPSDMTAPSFLGVTSAVATSDSQIMASWSPASDDVTAAANIVYLVCWNTSATACTSSFTAMATTAQGATSYTTPPGTLAPSTSYTFVVRAMDVPGNIDTNTATATASTLSDMTAPSFGGVTSAVATGETQITASWSPATDLGTASANIVYLVCWNTSSTACTTSFTAMATTAPGATSYQAGGIGVLAPGTTYTFVVRAEDAVGNVDTNIATASATTSTDATAPTWGTGPLISQVNADGVGTSRELLVTWTAATDDAWPSSAITYELCWDTTTSCSTTFVAMQTTAGGATSATISGLTSYTLYYVRVRAVDGSLNPDTGVHTGNKTTPASYADDIAAKIYNAPNTVGGCSSSGGGCHAPWTYGNTVGVSSSCPTVASKYVAPFNPNGSLIYLKMAGLQSTCGSRMPLGGPYDSNLVFLMQTWINEGAHNN